MQLPERTVLRISCDGKKRSAAEGFECLTLLLQGVKDSSYKHAGVFFPRLAAAGETKPCHQGGSERYKKPQLPDTMSCCRAMPTVPAPCLLPLTRLGKRSLYSQCGQRILPVATSSEDLWGWWPWGHHILHGNPWPGMGRCGVGQLRQELGQAAWSPEHLPEQQGGDFALEPCGDGTGQGTHTGHTCCP